MHIGESARDFIGSSARDYQPKVSAFFNNMASYAEALDRLITIGQQCAAIAHFANTLKGNSAKSEISCTVSEAFRAAREGLGVIRLVPIAFKGRGLFLKQYKREDVLKARSNGIEWIREGDFKKVALDAKTGEYVDNPKGEYVTRDWMDIAMDVMSFAARILSPLTWLNQLKAIDLGKHAARMGQAVVGLWAAVLALNLVQNIRDLADAVNDPKQTDKIREYCANVFMGAMDLITLVLECLKTSCCSPEVAIVVATISLFDAVAYLVKETLYYS